MIGIESNGDLVLNSIDAGNDAHLDLEGSGKGGDIK
jgi:hypothetical protein